MSRSYQLSLDGVWRMAHCRIGQGAPERFGGMETMACAVPGDVRSALISAGLMQEPLNGTQDLDCRWVEEEEFWLEKAFSLTAEQLLPHLLLTFEGLDCTAEIWLNGERLGSANNALIAHSFDVAGRVHAGENTLLVRLDDGLAEARRHDLARMGESWNNDQPWRVWMRKPQFVYGWDWTVWLSTCGIWRPVHLDGWADAHIHDVYTEITARAVGDGQPCQLQVSAEVAGPRTGLRLVCRMLEADGVCVAEGSAGAEAGTAALALTVPAARLWWCAGMGEPYLYELETSLMDAHGGLLDQRRQRVGLKTISLAEPALPHGDTGFTFLLNGEPVFCRGACHVPCDCLPGRITPEKERRLVSLAREAGMNMLRVWGGGVYASDALMDACDRAGIMVWHDFMFACGYYPDHDPSFMARVEQEARQAIRRLRAHASLIGWAGNNEIQEMHATQARWKPDLPFYGRRIYEELLPALARELCPALVYRASSPLGGQAQADCHHGDQHIWVLTHVSSHPHYMDLWRYTDFDIKFFSEFGIIGAMSEETARACIPAEHFHPDDPVWLHHCNTSQQGQILSNVVDHYFGSHAGLSAEEFIRRSQALQAELTRHIYEEFRRRKFACSGLLFWTLSDSMGIHNWSLIDYGLRRKPAWHAVRRAMAPCALSIRGWDVQNDEGRAQWRFYWAHEPWPLTIWGMNDTRSDRKATLSWQIMTVHGQILRSGERACFLPANESICLAEIRVNDLSFEPEHTVLRAQLRDGQTLLNETRYFFAPFSELLPEQPDVQLTWTPLRPGEGEVTVHSSRYVWCAHLPEPDGVQYSDNDFDLWPNERRTVLCHYTGAAPVPRITWPGMG